MIEINRNPSRRDLLIFAWSVPILFAVVGTFFWRAGWSRGAEATWLLGVTVFLVAVASPAVRRSLYGGWMYATYPIAWTISRALLVVIYFAVATPVALILRALRRDPMSRELDKAATSYWDPREPKGDRARYFRQF